MKLLSLNVWGGRQGKLLTDYLVKQAEGIDIFCFQEVFSSSSGLGDYRGARVNLFAELAELLPDYQAIFSRTYGGWVDMHPVDFEVAEGQALFIKKSLPVKTSGQVYIHGSDTTQIIEDFSNEPKDLQYAVLEVSREDLLIANVHGKWHPGDKLDTPERLEQSRIIKAFVDRHRGPKIICGDFNLVPETESIRMLEDKMVNLVKTYHISNTRNEISWQTYGNKQHFADFTFVSPEVKVKNFEVPYNLVSDHLPMILKFDL
ncbi:MAG: endonuclease/exonuclease/phosphatase family protein [Patescibacteria group bacterium]|nr:endonuclease/exonuclease/phosphatase family protein [Patescibacteria group bacterium]